MARLLFPITLACVTGWPVTGLAAEGPADAARPALAPTADVTPSRPAGPVEVAAASQRPRETSAPYTEGETLQDGSYGKFQRHNFLSAGLKIALVPSAGFDPYASDDALTYFSLSAGRTWFVDQRLSFFAALGFDAAGRSDLARGSETSLSVLRFSVSPELRYHLFKRAFAFGRVGLGVAHVSAQLEDSVIGDDRKSEHTTFTSDLGVGFAYAVASSRSMQARSARLWLMAEGGLLYVPTLTQKLASSSQSPARASDVVFHDLALLGPYFKLGAALSF